MKKIYLIKTLLLLCALVAGSGSVWADETYSLTPNQASTGSNATSYITTLTEFTYNGVSWKMNQWNPNTLQIRTNQTSATSEFRFYNTSAFSGKIKQVVIKFSALTISDVSKLMFLGGTSEVTATTGGTAGTWNSTTKTLTWTPSTSDNFTYFAFYQDGKAASGTNNLAESDAIVVTYESSSAISTSTTIDATGITNTDVYTNTAAGSLSATVMDNNNNAISGATVSWSSSDENVATINANGVVTLVAAGTVTFTANYAGVTNQYQASSATYEMTVTSSAPYVQPTTIEIVPNYTFWGKTSQFSGNTYDELSGNKDNVTLEWSRGNGSTYANTSAMRFYKDNTLTFTAPEGYVIKSIVIAGTLQEDQVFSPEGFDVTSQTWTGSSSTVTMSRPSDASNYATYSKFTITIGTPSSIAAPTFSIESGAYPTNLSVELSCATDGASIYYTTDGTTPNASSTLYNGPISVTTTTTIKAVAIKDGEMSDYSIANYTIKKDVVLNINSKSLPFGDSYTITSGPYSTRDVQTDGEVSISSSNPSVVSVNGLTITAAAVGTATITVTTTEGETYKAGTATFNVTVTAPEGQTEALPSGDVTLFHETFGDNAGSARDWDNSYSVKSGVATVYSDITGYTITNAKQTKNTVGSTQSGLSQTTTGTDASIIIGPLKVAKYSNMTLTYQWKAASIKGTYSTSAYYSTSAEGEYTEITGTGDGATTFVERSYTLPATAQVDNLYLKIVWNTSNTQAVIDEVNLSYTAPGSETVKLNGSGYATYCSQYPLDFTNAEANGYSAWQITDIGSDNAITFVQISGSVKGGTGVFLKGNADKTIELISADSETVLSGNKLVGTLAPTYVAADEYYGLSGNNFVKVNAGTVPAGKALIPASLITATDNARPFTFIFADEATGISEVEHGALNADENFYDLQGRRVVKAQKGLYIVNGKKVIMK